MEAEASRGVDRWKRPWTCVLRWYSAKAKSLFVSSWRCIFMENRTECKASAKCDGWVKSDAFCRLDSPKMLSRMCIFFARLAIVHCYLFGRLACCELHTASEPEGAETWLETETGLVVANAKGVPH